MNQTPNKQSFSKYADLLVRHYGQTEQPKKPIKRTDKENLRSQWTNKSKKGGKQPSSNYNEPSVKSKLCKTLYSRVDPWLFEPAFCFLNWSLSTCPNGCKNFTYNGGVFQCKSIRNENHPGNDCNCRCRCPAGWGALKERPAEKVPDPAIEAHMLQKLLNTYVYGAL